SEPLRKGGRAQVRTWGDFIPDRKEPVDDFAPCYIESRSDIHELFENYYFGCEADDRFAALAFKTSTNPMKARLKPLFSSDIGHFDVPDMVGVLAEAYEQIEHEWMSPDEFEEFTFLNAVRFYTKTNPEFFRGTFVDRDVEKVLANKSD